MNLLKAVNYDPAVAVTKNTTAALAMTALDTTNLRLAITVPAHGMVRFRLSSVIHGATTFPSILLGVMNGATVLGRVAPMQLLGNTAVATALVAVVADFTATGLTPGAMNVDAAYGVETLVAATGLKYGGPNNATANDAFGGFVFEAWDPQPLGTASLSVDANGRVDVGKVLGTAQTAGDIIARLPAALVSGRMDSSVGAMAAAVITAAAHAAGAIDANAIATDAIGSAELAASAVSEIATAIWDELTATARAAGSYGQLVKDDINATISSRASSAALATVQADTDDIQTRLPAALVGGRMDANLGALGGTVQSATDLKDLADTGYDPVLHLVSATAVVAAPVSLVAAYDAAKTAAQAGDAMALTVAERASVADKLLGRTRAGGADGGRTVAQCLALGRNKWDIIGTTLTVYADDGTTPLYTAAVTQAAGNPITSVVPA